MVAVKQYFWLIHLGLIALGGYIGADLFWAIMESRLGTEGGALTLSQSAALRAPEKRAFQQYAVIQERNLFGARGRAAAPAPKPPAPAPTKAPLNLKLVGTVVGSPANTYAVIEDLSAKKQDLYRIGDLIREAKVLEITRSRVVLDNRGRREELLSFQETAAGSAEPAPRQASLPTPVPRPGLAPRPAPPSQESAQEEEEMEIQKVGENTWRITRDELTEQFDNLSQILAQTRLTPHFTAGQPDGFMITNIPKNSFLDRIGLRNGDIMKAINGQKFNTLEEVFQAYRQMQTESLVQLEVGRSNRSETLTYEIR